MVMMARDGVSAVMAIAVTAVVVRERTRCNQDRAEKDGALKQPRDGFFMMGHDVSPSCPFDEETRDGPC